MNQFPKPDPDEYGTEDGLYINLLDDDKGIIDQLLDNFDMLKDMVSDLSEEELATPWAEGEWTVKEILVHCIDGERIYAYRALRFARNDSTPLPGFEDPTYVPFSGANNRPIEKILAEYETVRMATIMLFDSLDAEALLRTGVANGHGISVRAIAYHIAGHELHHIHSIKENYLST